MLFRSVQRGELPSEMPELSSDAAWRTIADVLVASTFASSKREAERLVAGNGVKLDGVVVGDPRAPWSATPPVVLSVGTRRFVRITS